MNKRYIPINPDTEDDLIELSNRNDESTIHYFSSSSEIKTLTGKVESVEAKGNEIFMHFTATQSVRADRIITFNGKPGPAYDEYDSYSNACMRCDDVGQF